MKCSRCGAELIQGHLYCDKCGQEVQLVPDYNPLEHIISEQNKINKEKQKKERKIEREQKKKLDEKKKKFKNRLIITCILLFICIIMLVGAKLLLDYRNNNSYTYQYSNAKEAYANEDYEKALKYTDRAISLDSQSAEANLLMASIMEKQEKYTDAITIISSVIRSNPDNEDAYRQILTIYEEQNMVEEIKDLMDSCESDSIKETFSEYITKDPAADLESGSYDYFAEASFSCEDGVTMYYTTNNTEPDENSTVYTGAISLIEGTNHIKIIGINEKGIKSNIVSCSYTLSIPRPAFPNISPSSGEFFTDTKIVVSVPDGCVAYYAFDKEPTQESKQYTTEIDMPEGEHIFYAIIVDKNGKVSYPASQTYVLNP